MRDISRWVNTPWLTTLAGVVLCVVLTAVVGYGISQHQKEKEIAAKREALSQALLLQLSLIGETVPPYDGTQAFYRDPIHLTALPPLLDGGTLEYRSHGALITALLLLQASIAKYNDFVQTTNLTQNRALAPDSIHEKMYADMVRRHRLVLMARAAVLKYLPEIAGSQAPNPADRPSPTPTVPRSAPAGPGRVRL